ncbi:hypothetical protein A0H81_04918 [Grifola frondosa]|uniref:Uncharacterized protein n=1 Tax=Grifola frondosa TaxID=5627 RepID=A0A1C7MF91_GRIFR|nr:hypothetical protein A0H81_04918 [Grifola frondosa]
MSIDDPIYATLYYRAYKIDKDIIYIIKPPSEIIHNAATPNFEKKDINGKLTMPDGTIISRAWNESIVQALFKKATPQSNFITLSSEFEESLDSSSSYNFRLATDSEEDMYVMPADQAPKMNKEAQKARFEGIFPPAKPNWASVPIDISPPKFNPLDDDDIMEDVENTYPPKVLKKDKQVPVKLLGHHVKFHKAYMK